MVKNVGLPSPARGAMAARLLKVPGTWVQTAAVIPCGAGSLHRVGSWHQRRMSIIYTILSVGHGSS